MAPERKEGSYMTQAWLDAYFAALTGLCGNSDVPQNKPEAIAKAAAMQADAAIALLEARIRERKT